MAKNASPGRGSQEIALEAVPNVSEGDDAEAVESIGRAFARAGCSLLDTHSDPDYGRSVFTLVGSPQSLADSILAGARETVARIDIRSHRGVHPCIGALDVVPVVYLREQDRALARDEALAVGNMLAGDLNVPVFLYGELATSPERAERAYFRDGGLTELADRMERRDVEPDFGPVQPHATAGATLVSARPPLVAFNLELDTTELNLARSIAARVREQGGGLPGVRAIGVKLERQRTVHLSMNVHDPFAVPLAEVVQRVRDEAGRDGVQVTGGEVVGLCPAAALDGFPQDVPLRDFDEQKHVLERRLV
jgi:glutamate formiminotransferase